MDSPVLDCSVAGYLVVDCLAVDCSVADCSAVGQLAVALSSRSLRSDSAGPVSGSDCRLVHLPKRNANGFYGELRIGRSIDVFKRF